MEGIIDFTKTDEEFKVTYIDHHQGWFLIILLASLSNPMSVLFRIT